MNRKNGLVQIFCKLRKICASFVKAPEQFDILRAELNQVTDEQKRLQNLQMDAVKTVREEAETRLIRLEERINRIEMADETWQSTFLKKLYARSELIGQLNTELSIHPTLWGKPERLDVSPLASVFTCFFNTNSGRITVGDYTFAGSGVSILAGSHDPQLKDFLRRDAELTEGCDIRIGRGVWLASNCTVLGPCTIGDNAVIAAGAVIVPGTEVPSDTVYGGIPARQIARLAFPDTPLERDPAVLRALERNDGILFTEGWTPREAGILRYPGHWLRREGNVLVAGNRWRLLYRIWNGQNCNLEAEGSAGKKTFMLENREGDMEVILPCGEASVETVTLRTGREDLFLMFVREDARSERRIAENEQ